MAAGAGADIIQLDKLSPGLVEETSKQVKKVNRDIIVAAAGGINGNNAEAYAAAGADVLVSSWMYVGKPADYKVTIRKI